MSVFTLMENDRKFITLRTLNRDLFTQVSSYFVFFSLGIFLQIACQSRLSTRRDVVIAVFSCISSSCHINNYYGFQISNYE